MGQGRQAGRTSVVVAAVILIYTHPSVIVAVLCILSLIKISEVNEDDGRQSQEKNSLLSLFLISPFPPFHSLASTFFPVFVLPSSGLTTILIASAR